MKSRFSVFPWVGQTFNAGNDFMRSEERKIALKPRKDAEHTEFHGDDSSIPCRTACRSVVNSFFALLRTV